MSRSRMLVFTGLLIGLVLLLAVAVWAFFIFQSRNSSTVALLNKPVVTIVSPPSGSVVPVNGDVPIHVAALDVDGVLRVELWVNGQFATAVQAPTLQGDKSFAPTLIWKPASAGTYALEVRALNRNNVLSDPAPLTLNVQEGAPTLTPTATPDSVATAAASASAVPTPALAATTAPSAAATATDTSVPGAPSSTPSPTAINTSAAPTAANTSLPPTATNTSVPPTNTPTNTPIPPTATDTPVPPTNTPTNTPVPPTNTPTNTPVPFSVTNASVSVNPPSSSACPVTFNFSGQITTNGAGTVTYVWDRTDNTSGSNQNIGFGSAGTQMVNDSWTVGTAGSYGERLRIVSPGSAVTNQATATETCGNFAGNWYLNFGSMGLGQSSSGVSGLYFNNLVNNPGSIAGTVNGNTFDGTYTINGGSTPLHLTLGNNGQTVDGNGSNAIPKWCGARPSIDFPAGCGFAGAWNAREDSTATDKVTLTQNGTSVSGTFFNGTGNGTFSNGTVSYSGGQAVMTGIWHFGFGSGAVKFYLVGYDDLQFQGHYNTNNTWCGWRGGAAQPSPCEK